MLFELTQDIGRSLSVTETLSVVGVRLKRLVPYESIAVYVRRDKKLEPAYVNGENFRLFSSLEIPIGQGLSGWVADNNKPILNGNPSVEAGYLSDLTKFSTLRSALAVPLQGINGNIGVLAIYRAEKDAFSREDLRILLAVGSKLAMSLENALLYQTVEKSATTDYMTNLPNARSLFMRLETELARCKTDGHSVRPGGLRPGRIQAGQRSLRAPGGQQDSPLRGPQAAGKLPRVRLRGAHGWR